MKKLKNSDKWALGILFLPIGLCFVACLIGPLISPWIGMGGIQRSKKLQTANDLAALHQALNYFHGEYARLPSIGSEGEALLTEGSAGGKLLTILMGKEGEGSEMQNPRHISFLNSKVSKNKNKGGLVYSNGGSGSHPEGFYDAWGSPFHVYLRKLDASRLTFSYGGQSVSLDQPVAVFSCGPDKIPETKDDLKFW